LKGVKINNNASYRAPAIDTPAVRIDPDFSGSKSKYFTNSMVYSKKGTGVIKMILCFLKLKDK